MAENTQKIKILFVEDLVSDYELARAIIKREKIDFDSKRVENANDMLDTLKNFKPHIVVSDYSMPQFNGMDALKLLYEYNPDIPFIILTGSTNEEIAVLCIKAGAVDYVIKERIKRLPFAIIEALNQAKTKLLKRQAEKALIKSEERFRMLAENAQDLIFRYEFAPKMGYKYLSPSALNLTGYSTQEFYNNPELFKNIVHPNDWHIVDEIIRTLVNVNKPLTVRWQKKDGSWIWIEQKSVFIFNSAGELIAIEGVARDITDRKLAEEALCESEERYRNIFLNAPIGIYRTTPQGEIVLANPALIKMLDYSSFDELKKMNLNSGGFDRNYLRSEFIEKIEKQKVLLNFESSWLTKKGNTIYVVESAKVVSDSEGKTLYYEGMVEDISERKQAELAIRKSEEKYRLLFMSNPNPMWVYSTVDYMFLAANEIAVENYGYSLNEFLGMSLFDIRPESEWESLKQNLIEEEQEFETSGPWIHKYRNGTEVYVDISSQHISFEGQPARLVLAHNVTDRVNATREIAEQRKLAQATLDSLSANICVINRDGTIVSVNNNWYEFAKSNGADLTKVSVGVNYYSVCKAATGTDAESANLFLWGIHLVLRGEKEMYELEYECHSSEQKRWFIARVTPITTNDKITMAVIAHENITDRKLSEVSIRENEERYSTFLNTTSDVAFIKDEFFRYLFINEAGLKMFGRPLNEIVGKTDFDLIKHEYAHNYNLTDKKALVQDRVLANTEKVDDLFYETRKFRLKLKNGRFGIGCFIRNVTERYVALNKIEESERKYKDLVENALVGVYTTNTFGEFQFANQALCSILGFKTPVDLMKINVKSLYKTESDRESFLNEVAQKGRITNYELDMKTQEGELINISLSATRSNKIISGMILDITEKKKAEKELIQKNLEIELQNKEYKRLNEQLLSAKEKAEEADKLKTAFLQNLSHEIRTPMNGIMGFSQLLRDCLNDFETSVSYLSIIEKSGERLMNLINDLVEISKVETGQITLANETFDVNEVIKELHFFFTPIITNKNLDFIITELLPNEKKIIHNDRLKLFQVLSNITKNAIKFTERGRIEIGCTMKNQSIEFFVKDTGIGIPKGKEKIIFERFSQIDTSLSSGYEGAGLGLAISKAYIEKMGGRIWVNNSMETGTIFYFTLPYP